MMYKVKIVGMGPGHPDYILPVAVRAIEEADILVGGARNLAAFKYLEKEEYIFRSNLEELYKFVEQKRQNKNLCVLVSGDPGFYSLLDFFSRRIHKEELEVIPGISSFQYLFCKIGKVWKDYGLYSAHGRSVDLTGVLGQQEGIFMLTDHKQTPARLAEILLQAGWQDVRMTVGENLSYPEERIVIGTPGEIINQEFNSLTVVVIEKNDMGL